jgi:hypothetical protein
MAMEKRLIMRFESVLQRWQNYPNIAPFVEGVNRYPLSVIRGSLFVRTGKFSIGGHSLTLTIND